MKLNIYFTLFILLLGLTLTIAGLSFPYLEDKLLPVLIGGVVSALAAIELVRQVRGEVPTVTAEKPVARARAGVELGRFATVIGWLIGFGLGVYLVGFLIAIPIFGFCYIKAQRRSWLTAISFALVVTVFIYAIFEFGFAAHLYRGLIFQP